jgi:hypothetical protein
MTDDERKQYHREWYKKYYDDPAHPERREKKNRCSREHQRRKYVEVGRWEDRDALPSRCLRMTSQKLEELAKLMRGRTYD